MVHNDTVMSEMYFGARPWRDMFISKAALESITWATGSQCRDLSYNHILYLNIWHFMKKKKIWKIISIIIFKKNYRYIKLDTFEFVKPYKLTIVFIHYNLVRLKVNIKSIKMSYIVVCHGLNQIAGCEQVCVLC